MAMVKSTIKSQLVALYNSAKSSPMTEDSFADTMADILIAMVKSASVSVPGAGLTAPSGGGAVTGTSTTGSLS